MQPATTILPGCRFRLVDGPAFVSQWKAIFEQESYAFEPSAPRPRILDCGANIGMASLYWTRAAPAARITAFEPDPQLVPVLRENLSACGASAVEVIEAAVWRANGEIGFRSGSPDASRVDERQVVDAVSCVRLRDYLAEPVELLKLDIEGAEMEVLGDCADRLDSVALLFVEFHSFERRAQRLDELFSILRGSGFRVHVASESASRQPFLRRDPYLGMDFQLNIHAYRAREL
jgi:FkbM family methyltransferase